MNFIEEQIYSFLGEGNKMEDIPFEMMEFWAKNGEIQNFSAFSPENQTLIFQTAGELEFSLNAERILLKLKDQEKMYRGLVVKELYKSFYNQIFRLEEEMLTKFSNYC